MYVEGPNLDKGNPVSTRFDRVLYITAHAPYKLWAKQFGDTCMYTEVDNVRISNRLSLVVVRYRYSLLGEE